MADIYGNVTGEQEVKAAVAPGGSGGDYVLPKASSTALGGVKADPKTAGDTQPVRIGQDGKLWTATGGGGTSRISDVQINGTSITADGVANIPVASTSQLGVAKAGTGISVGNDGGLFIQSNWDAQLSDRANRANQAVTLGFIDKTVTAVLTDGKAPALTDAQKVAAQSWLGIDAILGLVESVSEVVG